MSSQWWMTAISVAALAAQGQCGEVTRIWVELDRGIYPRYAPVQIRVRAEGGLPVERPPLSGDDIQLGGTWGSHAGPRGWRLDLFIESQDSVFSWLAGGMWWWPETEEQAARTCRRLIAEGVLAVPIHFLPFRARRVPGRDPVEHGAYELARFGGIEEVLAAWQPPLLEAPSHVYGDKGDVKWFPVHPDSAFERYLHSGVWSRERPVEAERCLTQDPGDYRLYAVVSPKHGLSIASPPAELKVERPVRRDSVAAETFWHGEILRTVFSSMLPHCSERAYMAASVIVDNHPGSPYETYSRYARGVWLYQLAKLSLAVATPAGVRAICVDSEYSVRRPFAAEKDKTSFSAAREELLKALQPPETFLTQEARRLVVTTYIMEGRGEEAAEALLGYDLVQEFLPRLEASLADYPRLREQGIRVYGEVQREREGVEACVRALRKRLGDRPALLAPDIERGIPW